MHAKTLRPADPRAWMLIFDIGDEVVETLERFAADEGIDGAALTALGAFERATLAYWNWDSKQYEHIAVGEQVEVTSLLGNLSRGPNGAPKLHAHAVLARRGGATVGGHLIDGHVRPTLEVTLVETPVPLHREKDERTGLTLLVSR